jgi:outer membrane protein OmpA-like peptidoglycan-associated protein/opacity protein-like surface antigen
MSQPRRTQLALATLVAVGLLAPSGAAKADALDNLKLELGAFGGYHIFANDLELGVSDDRSVTSPKNAGLVGLRLGVVLHPMFALEFEGVLLPTSDRHHDYRAYLGAGRAHLRFDFPVDSKLQPFALAGVGALTVLSTQGTEYDEIQKDTDFVYHFGVGAKYPFSDLVHMRLDGRLLETPNTKKNGVSADWEISAGLGLTFGSSPPPPPPKPVAPTDRDFDGIPDSSDKCPAEAGPADNGGCPDKDRDKDGVVDRKDKCPDVAGLVEREGCPVPDEDKDGIADDKDKCPKEPEDKDNFEDDDGCPDPDNDKDGVADANDKCPLEPETKNGFQDEDGCPDEIPVAIQKFTGVIRGITFRRNSADIKASSFPFLKEAVKTFKEYPTLRIEVSGHTSNDGKRAFNVKLSVKRAESVKAFLTSAGVEENRISTVGYGPDKPIEDNSTKKGQEKNRRIEFRLLSPDETTPPSVPETVPGDDTDKPAKKSKAKKEKTPAADAPMKPDSADAPAKPAKPAKKKKKAAAEPEGDPDLSPGLKLKK